MSASADSTDDAAAKAVHELTKLRREIAQARAELARLLGDVAVARRRLGTREAAQLLEANEQLVLSALRAQTDAETAAASAAQALQEARRSVELDPLTGLPNRVLLLDRVAQAIAGARRRGARSALLFLDLNNFKQVNDTLGHAVGDRVLELAAGRLASCVHAADTVSRHGGDEFLILLADVGTASDAVVVADKLSAVLGAPSRIGDQVIRLTASIGISLYPDDGDDAHMLIERADAAVYHAKRLGLRSFVFRHEASLVEPCLSTTTLRSLRQPLTPYQQARSVHEHQVAQLQEANQNLVLAALTAQQLQAAAEQAQAQQMGVLAVVAHELRNPLAPIRTAAALLGRGRADEPLLHRVQGVIERQVAHLTRLVGDLLDVSGAHAGKLRLERRTVDMADVIDEAVLSCRPAMDARLQLFSVFVPSFALPVNGDATRLSQVLCNLLDNASKYTQVGGEIGLSVVAADDVIVMTVSDNGIGIAAEFLPRVFEPFVQDKHAIGFSGSGLGIGLTVVRELVEAHGGSVAASSAGSGFGSQFVVTLSLLGHVGSAAASGTVADRASDQPHDLDRCRDHP